MAQRVEGGGVQIGDMPRLLGTVGTEQASLDRVKVEVPAVIFTTPRAELTEGKTTPPGHHSEDTILHAMETAGVENMPEDADEF